MADSTAVPQQQVNTPTDAVIQHIAQIMGDAQGVIPILVSAFVAIHAAFGANLTVPELIDRLRTESQDGTAEAWLRSKGYGRRFDGAWVLGYPETVAQVPAAAIPSSPVAPGLGGAAVVVPAVPPVAPAPIEPEPAPQPVSSAAPPVAAPGGSGGS